jgi:hypothetical protein
MGPIRFSKTLVNNYHTTPRNITEECRCLLCILFINPSITLMLEFLLLYRMQGF